MQTSPKASSVLAAEYLRELESEATATRACLEKVPMDKADWKPHDKSMPLGYLASMIAEMPKWIQHTAEKGEIDFGTFQHEKIETTDQLVAAFDANMTAVRTARSASKNQWMHPVAALNAYTIPAGLPTNTRPPTTAGWAYALWSPGNPKAHLTFSRPTSAAANPAVAVS